MARAPFQILVYPYRQAGAAEFDYALFRRSDAGWWQGVAGGGEDDETPLQAARRETWEEAGLSATDFMELDTIISTRVSEFGISHIWGEDVYINPMYCFGLRVPDQPIVLSYEHTEYRWLGYQEAYDLMRYDGNKTALWELEMRLQGCGPRGDNC